MNGSPWFLAADGTPVPRYLSAVEAAALLGISDTAVRDLCRRQRALPGALRFAHQWLIHVGAVERRLRAAGRILTAADVRAVAAPAPPRELARLGMGPD